MKLYQLFFYVPEDALHSVKQALFDVGAGRIGSYDQCCFQVRGEGQFRPLAGSDPYIGVHGEVERVLEYKVEMVFEESLYSEIIHALKSSHPYETPAYGVIPLNQ